MWKKYEIMPFLVVHFNDSLRMTHFRAYNTQLLDKVCSTHKGISNVLLF